MKSMFQAGILLIVMTIISGVIYPAFITAVGQFLWHEKSNGSLIMHNGMVIGSSLIAQNFTSPQYFWSRPSASDFNAVPSGASNLGPTSKDLARQIERLRSDLSEKLGVKKDEIPMDLLTTSASGLDPHISLKSARLQIKRIAKARNLKGKEALLQKLIDDALEHEQFFIFGEKRINVLTLNIALDRCCPSI